MAVYLAYGGVRVATTPEVAAALGWPAEVPEHPGRHRAEEAPEPEAEPTRKRAPRKKKPTTTDEPTTDD